MVYDWNATFEAQPSATSTLSLIDNYVRQFKVAFRERFDVEHNMDTTQSAHGKHRKGSAVAYYQTTAPASNLASEAFSDNEYDRGRLWVESDDDKKLCVWTGTEWRGITKGDSNQSRLGGSNVYIGGPTWSITTTTTTGTATFESGGDVKGNLECDGLGGDGTTDKFIDRVRDAQLLEPSSISGDWTARNETISADSLDAIGILWYSRGHNDEVYYLFDACCRRYYNSTGARYSTSVMWVSRSWGTKYAQLRVGPGYDGEQGCILHIIEKDS